MAYLSRLRRGGSGEGTYGSGRGVTQCRGACHHEGVGYNCGGYNTKSQNLLRQWLVGAASYFMGAAHAKSPPQDTPPSANLPIQKSQSIAAHSLECAPSSPKEQHDGAPASPKEQPDIEDEDENCYAEPDSLYNETMARCSPERSLPHVRLLRWSFLDARATAIEAAEHQDARRELALPRRQELEATSPEAFYSAMEVRALPRGGNRAFTGGPLCIVAVSHTWETPEHPDPTGRTLVRLARAVRRAQNELVGLHSSRLPRELAIFFDVNARLAFECMYIGSSLLPSTRVIVINVWPRSILAARSVVLSLPKGRERRAY